jgi:hypothetical protein
MVQECDEDGRWNRDRRVDEKAEIEGSGAQCYAYTLSYHAYLLFAGGHSWNAPPCC